MRAVLPLVFLALFTAVAAAQPADKPDFNRAAELYKQAESEMSVGQYADAARDYAIAFDITKDPVLFFKIASANDKAGRCDLALTYYRRYLKEGKPNAEFEKLTTERIGACEKITAGTGTGTGTGTSSGTVTEGTGSGTGAAGKTGTGTGSGSGSGSGSGTGTGTPDDSTAQLTGEKPSLTAEKPSRKRSAASEASEKDIQDLYDIRVGGRPAEWTPDLQQRYDDLIDQGDRYEKLSWVAFGVAGAAIAGAVVLFVVSSGDSGSEQPPVSLSVTGSGATISGGWSF
jgi:hypothetical protein